MERAEIEVRSDSLVCGVCFELTLLGHCRGMDLNMLSILNARERDADEWGALFAEADPRFEFQGVKRSNGSYLAIMEAIWNGSTSVPDST